MDTSLNVLATMIYISKWKVISSSIHSYEPYCSCMGWADHIFVYFYLAIVNVLTSKIGIDNLQNTCITFIYSESCLNILIFSILFISFSFSLDKGATFCIVTFPSIIFVLHLQFGLLTLPSRPRQWDMYLPHSSPYWYQGRQSYPRVVRVASHLELRAT